ncbi:MAG: hypothetical protein H6Q48_2515, partial [Deltaproteobacteria bacterium]|nr:hypothetical protein [Deltaproteobacteria bacterium]
MEYAMDRYCESHNLTSCKEQRNNP